MSSGSASQQARGKAPNESATLPSPSHPHRRATTDAGNARDVHSNDLISMGTTVSPLRIVEPPQSTSDSQAAAHAHLSRRHGITVNAAEGGAKGSDQAGQDAATTHIGRPVSLPPAQNRFESRGRVHTMINTDMKEIVALRELIDKNDKKLGDSDQQNSMDAVFVGFVDSLREAQIAGLSEPEVLKTLDTPIRFSGSQFIDWAVHSVSSTSVKPIDAITQPEAAGISPLPSSSSRRGLHEAQLLMLSRSGCIQPTYQKTPPSLDCSEAIFEIEGSFCSVLPKSNLPSAHPWQVIITPTGDISYGVPGRSLTSVLASFARVYFEQFPGRTSFMARELASWLLEARHEGGDRVCLVSSTEKALAIGKRMVLHELIVPCRTDKVFPQVCGDSKVQNDNLFKESKNFKYNDNRYYVNPIALYSRELCGDASSRKSRKDDVANTLGGSRSRSYNVIVRTGKAAGGGTSGPVYISLLSHLGCTWEQQLHSTFSNAFDRAEEHVFSVLVPQDVGRPTHVVVRLAATADPWQLHSLIVCNESFSENSVFIYKNWLKPNCLSVTLGSQGSLTSTGDFKPNAVLSQNSYFRLTVTKFENLSIPEGFSKLMLNFDQQEVGFIDLIEYQALFRDTTVLPLVECHMTVPVLCSARDDDDQHTKIELIACKQDPGNPQLQAQFVAESDFSSQMISMTGMRQGSVTMQLKPIDDQNSQKSVNLDPPTITLAFEERQDVDLSSHVPVAASWIMPAEVILLIVNGVQVTCGHMGSVWSNLVITNFRARAELLFDVSSGNLGNLQPMSSEPVIIDVPLAFVRTCHLESVEGVHQVKLKTFDGTLGMRMTLGTAGNGLLLRNWGLSICRHAINLCLFGSRPPWKFIRDSAVVFRAAGGRFPENISAQEREFERFGINGAHSIWRETHANSTLHREVCPSYPAVLAVPTSVSDKVVRGAASFRSSGRFPCLSWAPPRRQAVRAMYGFICRSSQPNVGVFDHTSPDDEKLIKAMTDIKGRLIIFDCRPEINATANKAKGKGNIKAILSNYPGVQLECLDIENIHCVREAHTKLAKACANMKSELGDFDDKGFWNSVADSKWLLYLSDIVGGSMKVVRSVAAGTGVLVHCSDGWDRTPQITSLSSIILDPFYRTAVGFFVLVEKEWCNMGHKFADRLGCSIKKDQEESPVFLQWLDCVWQLWRQCPIAFEFNEVMLLHFADQVYSGRWLHFTHNCHHDLEKDNALAAISSSGQVACPPSFASAFLDAEATPSGVEFFSEMELKQQFRNEKYAPQLCDGVLFISSHQRSMQIWPYHFRWVCSILRSHQHPDVVTAELPKPSYLMNVVANVASVPHTEAIALLNRILPSSEAQAPSPQEPQALEEGCSPRSATRGKGLLEQVHAHQTPPPLPPLRPSRLQLLLIVKPPTVAASCSQPYPFAGRGSAMSARAISATRAICGLWPLKVANALRLWHVMDVGLAMPP